MHRIAIAVLALVAAVPVHADIISFTFSGTWGGTLGLINTGDPFSGSLSWDSTSATNICTTDPLGRFCRPLLSFSYNMPAATGLSVPSLPDPKVFFAGALYASVNGAFEGIQVNEKSSVDNNFYIFFGGPPSAVSESNATFTQTIRPATFTSSVVPEVSSSCLTATVFGLVACVAIRRKRLRSV